MTGLSAVHSHRHVWGFASLLLLTGCVSSPRPYDGVLGYQVEPLAKGWQVTLTDEYRHSRVAMLEQIAGLCSRKTGTPTQPHALIIRSERELVKPVPMTILVAEGTQTTGSPDLGPPSAWAPIEPVTARHTVIQSTEVREITARCPEGKPSP